MVRVAARAAVDAMRRARGPSRLLLRVEVIRAATGGGAWLTLTLLGPEGFGS
jgi:hypothetical protein